ncbi:MAG: BamA/TamA family outer membrane protein [Chitinophagaceae bacterium]
MTKVEVYGHNKMWVLLAMLLLPATLLSQYRLRIIPVDKDSVFLTNVLKLQTSFNNQFACAQYVSKLPAMLQSRGYDGASVDSVRYDSLSAVIELYVGEQTKWIQLHVDSADRPLIGMLVRTKKGTDIQAMSYQQVMDMQSALLDYFENNGYPFAKIELDSLQENNNALYARLKIDRGPLYKIDSIRNNGTAHLSPAFLQRYLGIMNGSIYKKEKLQTVSKRLNDLSFVQEKRPWSLEMLGTGSILNLNLEPRRSSQVNVLVGFLPDSSSTGTKLNVIGEATINLKNALGGGETIGLNWQQIQQKSPRLDINFIQPYIFGSPFGVLFNFNLFKKDSTFLNIDMQFGAQYTVSAEQSGTVFLQNFRTNLLSIDTLTIKNTHTLPDVADLSSVNLGVNYQWYHTDYRMNPRKGTEWFINASVGTKKIRKNNSIIKLVDENDPSFSFNSLYDTVQLSSYQFRVKAIVAHYFKLGVSTIKTGANVGWFQSPKIYRNELFQIGGYKLLRGFDEESIYASQYAEGTLEYRYLIGRNSYLFTFVDGAWVRNNSTIADTKNFFLGAGLGMALETKAGVFNISYAVGKRDDTKFNFRQAKIHIGYVNYF